MANVILIPDGTAETQTTQLAGDLLVLAAGDTLSVDGASADRKSTRLNSSHYS